MPHLRRVALVPAHNILKTLSVLENVRLAVQAVKLPARAILSAPHSGARNRPRAARSTGSALRRTRRRFRACYSHGAQRQLEIAMALGQRPEGPAARRAARRHRAEGERIVVLLPVARARARVLLIEHDMDFVFKVANPLDRAGRGRQSLPRGAGAGTRQRGGADRPVSEEPCMTSEALIEARDLRTFYDKPRPARRLAHVGARPGATA